MINQIRTRLKFAGIINCSPELQQVIKVPLKLFDAAANASGAGNQAHAARHLELIHGLAQLLAILALDSARYTATARVIGH